MATRKRTWIPDNDRQVEVVRAIKKIAQMTQDVTTRKPSLEEIGKACQPKLSAATVHRCIRKMVAAGALTRETGKHRDFSDNLQWDESLLRYVIRPNRRRA